MMLHIYNFLLFALLWLVLAGLPLWVAHLTRLPYGLAKALTVVGGCLILFFVEHFVGLGQLGWLLPVAVAGALWGLWKHHGLLRAGAGAEVAFVAGFAWAMAWRYLTPDIDASSEKLADLNFIVGYMSGGRLPAADPWMSGYALTQYYSFQHYAAGLLGRIFALPPGTTYNVAHCVIPGLVLAAASDWVRVFVARRWVQALILAALLLGGTGVCLLTPKLLKNEQTFSSNRFIGAALAVPNAELSPRGIALRERIYGPGDMPAERREREKILDLPTETFSYSVLLGDYHAPLSGYVLMAMGLAAFGVLLRRPEAVPRRWATGILLGTVPMSIASHTWIFPLQSVLVATCLAYLWIHVERPRWVELAAVALPAWLLLYPFLSYFLARSIGSEMKPKLVPAALHSPASLWWMQMWPIVGLVAMACVAPFARGALAPRRHLWFPALAIGLLVLMEFVYINDIYVGRFERFNTTLKWWPWVAALCTLLLAPLSLADVPAEAPAATAKPPGKGQKPATKPREGAIASALRLLPPVATAGILLFTLCYVKTLCRDWYNKWKLPTSHVGALDGSAWLRLAGQNPDAPQNLTFNGTLMNYLATRPRGVALEPQFKDDNGVPRMAFCESGALSLFTGHRALVGWPSHEQLWRGYQWDIARRWSLTSQFYAGTLANPLAFLEENDVRYILWPAGQEASPSLFEKIEKEIGEKYRFVRFDDSRPLKGIWERRTP